VPGEGEGVGWVPGFVGCDGPGETAVADVAPLHGLDLGIGVEYWLRTGQTVSEMIWMLMLVMVFEVKG
jgi:hypothetical protein